MAKLRLSKEEIEEKENYREFFKKFKDCREINYLLLVDKKDRNSLSTFMNNENTRVHPVSVEKLKYMKQTILTNLDLIYENLRKED